jgi:hypothetical protein
MEAYGTGVVADEVHSSLWKPTYSYIAQFPLYGISQRREIRGKDSPAKIVQYYRSSDVMDARDKIHSSFGLIDDLVREICQS